MPLLRSDTDSHGRFDFLLMFIIDPDPYSLPAYRIGPFRTRDVGLNHNLPDSNTIDAYFNDRFGSDRYIYTYNGREAIHKALASFNLTSDDVVTILTTSGNFYISGCVTKEIERYCKWSRKMEANTKLIFVNHEFGYPYENLGKLKEYNLPIIEDCAGSFFSSDQKKETGFIGDFVVYSFPKMFPLQIGGMLVSNQVNLGAVKQDIDTASMRYIRNVLSHYIEDKDQIISQRIQNYHYLLERFKGLGFTERFFLREGSIPGVFMFSTKHSGIDLNELKTYFWAHGVQCSIFYHEETFFIPVHQALNETDLDYFYEVMKSFLNKLPL